MHNHRNPHKDQFLDPYFEWGCELPLYILESCKHFQIFSSHQRPRFLDFISKHFKILKEDRINLNNTTSPADDQDYKCESKRGH